MSANPERYNQRLWWSYSRCYTPLTVLTITFLHLNL